MKHRADAVIIVTGPVIPAFTLKVLPPIRRHVFRDAQCAARLLLDGWCVGRRRMKVYSPILELKPELIIETYIALLPFPTATRMADNYIHRFLKLTEQEYLAEEFGLMPFEITTQTIERTLIDKVFAICDYYLSDKVL